MLLKRLAAFAAAGALTLTLAACGSDSGTGASSTTMAPATTSAMTSEMTSEMSSEPMTSDMSSEPMTSDMGSSSMGSSAMEGASLVGPGCADYAAAVPTGAGSVEGMAQDPVATAASNNPLLTTLVAAVSGKLNPKVDLVSTLNSAEFTVFAPVDDAFGKIDAATIDKLKTDDALLSKILTYHVVPGRLDPSQVVGEHKTVEGGTVTVTGSGDSLKVNDASVICGGVSTKNATVYLIDTVLMPPAS
nr:fasciclin domain-containing protein [Nakamurella alba]